MSFSFLKKIYWGTDSVWSGSYFISTVGISEAVKRKNNVGRARKILSVFMIFTPTKRLCRKNMWSPNYEACLVSFCPTLLLLALLICRCCSIFEFFIMSRLRSIAVSGPARAAPLLFFLPVNKPKNEAKSPLKEKKVFQ